jgi:malonate-semialdehyde dehydrogenase (acetylating)/methylmalonate-semialdehyde dehydrogenase
MAKLWKEAGLPDGVFNVLNGNRTTVQAMLEDERIKAISFVGSTPVAKYIYEEGSKHGKRVQALGGAKNHALILPDADLDLVADSMINAGFGSAGERCMAISVAVAVEPVADTLIPKIVERMAKLRTGDGRRGCDMGPLVTKEHRDKVAGYIETAEKDGGRIIVDGRKQEFDGAADGFWLGPTLIDNVPLSSKAYQDEIFGPVLNIVRVKSYDEGVALINGGQYGNGSAIFTNDGGAARRFQYEIEAGMVGINVPIPVPVAYFSFGGWKNSAFGDTKAHGIEGVKFFTREKTMTSRWLDPSHGGINLGFPQN